MRLLTATLVFCAALHAQGSIQRLDGTRISTTDAATFARAELQKAHVTGAQIAITQNGRTVWNEAFGLRSKNPDQPMQRDTTMWAASITKSVFATYVMQLVEQGKLGLDAPIASLLSKPLDEYEPYKATAHDLVRDPRWQQVTPRMLLSHTSGLANFASLEADKKMHLHSAPGSEFRYSGDGLNILQFAIEERQGKPLDVLMNEAIFRPLGMAHTGLVWREEWKDNAADRFDAKEAFLSQTRRSQARGAGSMTTSAQDIALFTNALLSGHLLSSASMREMFTPQVQIHTVHQFPFAGDRPPSKEAERVGLAYGLGWGLLTKTKYGPAIFKEGHGDGAENYVVCFTQKKTCMVLLTNSDNGEFAFRPLLEKLIGDDVTPWEWECYTAPCIVEARKFN